MAIRILVNKLSQFVCPYCKESFFKDVNNPREFDKGKCVHLYYVFFEGEQHFEYRSGIFEVRFLKKVHEEIPDRSIADIEEYIARAHGRSLYRGDSYLEFYKKFSYGMDSDEIEEWALETCPEEAIMLIGVEKFSFIRVSIFYLDVVDLMFR